MCGGVYIYGTRAARDRQVGVGVGGPGRIPRAPLPPSLARQLAPPWPSSSPVVVARSAHQRRQGVPDARGFEADPSSRALGCRSLGDIRDIMRHGEAGADSRGARTLLLGGPWLDARCKWLAGTSGLLLQAPCRAGERVRALDGLLPPLPPSSIPLGLDPRPSPAPNPLSSLGFPHPRRFCQRI